MTLCFHAFCIKLTKRRIACRGMYRLDLPFVLVANRRIMLSGTCRLDLPIVFLPNEVHLFFKEYKYPDSMHSHAKMCTSLTTAFELGKFDLLMNFSQPSRSYRRS